MADIIDFENYRNKNTTTLEDGAELDFQKHSEGVMSYEEMDARRSANEASLSIGEIAIDGVSSELSAKIQEMEGKTTEEQLKAGIDARSKLIKFMRDDAVAENSFSEAA